MPQIINTNLSSLNAQRNLDTSQNAQSTALQRLSSGLRINSARDDAAGLAISTRFDTQVRGLNVAIRNAGDGVSLAQVAEGALGAMTNNLQRIRELALQAANDTNTALDRAALDAEVQQLVAEIDTVSTNAAFNGKKLLDGSFSSATFQTGANVGESISFDIAKATVDSLGTSTQNGFSSYRDTANNPLSAGDLVINGVAIGNSVVLDDSASTANADASALSIAAAINRSTESSGVSATVNQNVVGGTGTLADATGTIVINNTTINVNTDTTNLSIEANLAAVAQAINERSGESGVRAEVAKDPDGGINLVADDGRNIELADGTAAVADIGLAAALVYTGTYTLVSRDGAPINVESDSGNISNAGLSIGEYSGANSGAISRLSTDLASETAMAEGDIVINGVPIGGTTDAMDAASTTLKDQSAISIAEAINRVSEETGVTAEAQVTRVFSANVTSGAVASITINAVPVSTADQGDPALQTISLVDGINAVAGQTGVKAELVDGDSYVLIADDGRNIDISAIAGGSAIAVSVYGASVSLISAGQIDLSTNTGDIINSRFEVGVYGGGQSGKLLQDINVTSVEEAEDTIIAVDNALQAINIQRANLGAVQNRFESTISNQAIAAENLTAANSRIKDADFAAETAALSRAQVLQQAGISILGQANALPQQVLSLLQ